MTSVQQEQIRNLRIQGKTYSEISSELGMSRNTVKSYIARNPIVEDGESSTIEAVPPFKDAPAIRPGPTVKSIRVVRPPVLFPSDGHCRCCGEPLEQIPGRRKRFFCSEECRRK